MKLVEQAIFTSAEADREAGYQVVARSAGLCAADARNWPWGPWRDSLLELGPEAKSLNFHPLPSGAYCVSRSMPAGWEQGGGQRVHTQCRIVPPEVFSRFANNPLRMIRTVTDHGLWKSGDALPAAGSLLSARRRRAGGPTPVG